MRYTVAIVGDVNMPVDGNVLMTVLTEWLRYRLGNIYQTNRQVIGENRSTVQQIHLSRIIAEKTRRMNSEFCNCFIDFLSSVWERNWQHWWECDMVCIGFGVDCRQIELPKTNENAKSVVRVDSMRVVPYKYRHKIMRYRFVLSSLI